MLYDCIDTNDIPTLTNMIAYMIICMVTNMILYNLAYQYDSHIVTCKYIYYIYVCLNNTILDTIMCNIYIYMNTIILSKNTYVCIY